MQRRYDIDALRVIGTLLVFRFHCLRPFVPNDPWHIENYETSAALGAVIAAMNIWIMPLFMLLAGASSFFALAKRTNAAYLRERVTRILVPLVIGIFVLVAPQVYWERVVKGQILGGYGEFLPHFVDGVYPTGNFSWHHLWFLAYLFVYSVVGLALFRWLRGARGSAAIAWIASLVARRAWLLMLPAVPLAIFHFTLMPLFPPSNALVGDWAWHAQLFSMFVLGYVMVADDRFADALARLWRLALVIAVIGTGMVLWFREHPVAPEESFYWPMYAIRSFIFRLSTWTAVLVALGAGARPLGRGDRRQGRLAGHRILRRDRHPGPGGRALPAHALGPRRAAGWTRRRSHTTVEGLGTARAV